MSFFRLLKRSEGERSELGDRLAVSDTRSVGRSLRLTKRGESVATPYLPSLRRAHLAEGQLPGGVFLHPEGYFATELELCKVFT